MFKKMPVCRLMISCPSDVKTEIEIINRVVDNINDSIGFSMNIFVKTLIRHVQDTKLIRRMSTTLSLLRFQIICVAVLTH